MNQGQLPPETARDAAHYLLQRIRRAPAGRRGVLAYAFLEASVIACGGCQTKSCERCFGGGGSS